MGLRDVGVLSWSQRSDTWQSDTTVTALNLGGLLLDVVSNQLATWGLDNLDLVGSGVVCLLVYGCSTDGVYPCYRDTLITITFTRMSVM